MQLFWSNLKRWIGGEQKNFFWKIYHEREGLELIECQSIKGNSEFDLKINLSNVIMSQKINIMYKTRGALKISPRT